MCNDFFLDAATNLKERDIFLVEPVSSLETLVWKAGVQFKRSFMQASS